MTCLRKRSRLAQSKRPLGSVNFTNGLGVGQNDVCVFVLLIKFAISTGAHHLHTGLYCLTNGKFTTAQKLLPEILDSCPVKVIRAFLRKSWRYMNAYRYVHSISHCYYSSPCRTSKGLTAKQIEFAREEI